MEFTKEECIEASSDLKTVSSTISNIFTDEFGEVMSNAENIYKSAEATALEDQYKVLVNKFPEFKKSVEDAAAYLLQVADDYEAARSSVEKAING